jgi:hypothetical protein
MTYAARIDAPVLARYGIIQAAVDKHAHLRTRYGIIEEDIDNVDIVSIVKSRPHLTQRDKREALELACALMGLEEPRFSDRRTRLLKRSFSRHAIGSRAA